MYTFISLYVCLKTSITLVLYIPYIIINHKPINHYISVQSRIKTYKSG